jgi:hypothetical protein
LDDRNTNPRLIAPTGAGLVKQIRNVRLRRGNVPRGPYYPRLALREPGQADNWLMLTHALLAESGRTLLHDQVTDFDAEQKLDVSIGGFRFCPEGDPRRG